MTYLYQEYLAHHGVKGQQRGKRRYQNEDGTLTEEGKRHYAEMYGDTALATKEYRDKIQSDADRLRNKIEAKKTKATSRYQRKISEQEDAIRQLRDSARNNPNQREFLEGVAKDTEAYRDRLKAKSDSKAAKIDSRYARRTAKYERRLREQDDALRQLTAARKNILVSDVRKKKQK